MYYSWQYIPLISVCLLYKNSSEDMQIRRMDSKNHIFGKLSAVVDIHAGWQCDVMSAADQSKCKVYSSQWSKQCEDDHGRDFWMSSCERRSLNVDDKSIHWDNNNNNSVFIECRRLFRYSDVKITKSSSSLYSNIDVSIRINHEITIIELPLQLMSRINIILQSTDCWIAAFELIQRLAPI